MYDPNNFTGDPPYEPGPVLPLPAPPPAPPCDIVFKSGKVFYVTELDSWQWHDRGLFATGQFNEPDGEVDLLIPNESIEYVKYDFSKITVPEVGDE